MQGTPLPPPPSARRPTAVPLDNDLRAALAKRLDAGSPESIAAAASVSVATVRRAARGEPVRRVVLAALARVVGPNVPATVAA